MTPLLAATLCALLVADDPARTKDERKPSAIAPSLPALTDEEEDKLDEIVDGFIRVDTGKLKGAEAKKALTAFNRLGAEAIPALIRGINRAAAIEDSCPAVVIAKKLYNLLTKSNDPELLQFARENIGAGIKRSRHLGTLQDLRFFCTQRKNLLERQGTTAAGATTVRLPKTLTVTELATAAGVERGEKLKSVLIELANRQGDEVIGSLGSVAGSTYDEDMQKLARDLLHRHLSRQKETIIKAKLKDDRAEVRVSAARVAGEKRMRLGKELIDLFEDDEARVRDAAHDALVRLNKGTDLGPAPKVSAKERAEAARKWRDWWSAQGDK
jgi:hypothetical protein